MWSKSPTSFIHMTTIALTWSLGSHSCLQPHSTLPFILHSRAQGVSWGLPMPPLPCSDLSLRSLRVCTHPLMHWDSATLASHSCCWRVAGLPVPLSFCHHPSLCLEHPPDVLITHFPQVCPTSPPGQYFSCLSCSNVQ